MTTSTGYKAKIENMLRLEDVLAEKLADPEFAAAYEAAKRETTFALALADARESRRLTQHALSELTGIKQPQIARYEKGTLPDINQLVRLADALNVRIVIAPGGSMKLETLTAKTVRPRSRRTPRAAADVVHKA